MNSKGNSNLKWCLLALFSMVLLLPFAVLTAYVIPSADDYMFAYYTNSYGAFESMMCMYETWTGRYASMFLLSLHPLSVDSLFLYRLLTFFLFLLSFHAVYLFLRKVFGVKSRLQAVILSVVFLFVYISQMPDMVQGFYWMPGWVTYQLSNVLILYFAGSLFYRVHLGNTAMGAIEGVLHLILILVICGLSEVSFLLLNIVIGSLLLYNMLVKKKLNGWLIAFLIFAAICSVVVLMAPGASVRVSTDAVGMESTSVIGVLWKSMMAIVSVCTYWLQSLNLWLLTFVFFIVLATDSVSSNRIFGKPNGLYVAVGFIWGILFLLVSVVPMHYVFGDLTPDRAVNVTYWFFLVLWLFVLYSVFQWVVVRFQYSLSKRPATYVMVCLLLMISGSGYASRYYIAWNDWLSGRAAELSRQYVGRHAIMQNCSTDYCEFPAYSVFPKTIFNEDFGRYAGSDFTLYFANFYGHIYSGSTFTEPEFINRFQSDMEGEKPAFLSNWETCSNRNSRSGSYSSLLDERAEFSVSAMVRFSDLQPSNIHLLSRSEVSVYTLCEESLCEAQLVFSIEDSDGNTVFWRAKPIWQEASEGEEWMNSHTLIVLPTGLIKSDMTIKVYVWNNRPTPLFVDDIELIIY